MTNPVLFPTKSLLRTIERDVRYIPEIASAISRIICRSRNESLRYKSIGFFANNTATDDDDNIEQQVRSEMYRSKSKSWRAKDQEHMRTVTTNGMSTFEGAFQSRLRLAIKERNESMIKKRNKRLKTKIVEYEGYHDFNSNMKRMNGDKSQQLSILNDFD